MMTWEETKQRLLTESVTLPELRGKLIEMLDIAYEIGKRERVNEKQENLKNKI